MTTLPPFFIDPSKWTLLSRHGFKVGDKVRTTAGLEATIVDLGDKYAVVRCDCCTEAPFSIAYSEITKAEEKEAEEEDEGEDGKGKDCSDLEVGFDPDDKNFPVSIESENWRHWLTIDEAHDLRNEIDKSILQAYGRFDYSDDK